MEDYIKCDTKLEEPDISIVSGEKQQKIEIDGAMFIQWYGLKDQNQRRKKRRK